MILDYAHVSSEVSFLEELEEYQCVASRKKGRIGNLHSYWVANIQRYNIHKQSPRISIPVFIAVSIVTMRVQFGQYVWYVNTNLSQQNSWIQNYPQFSQVDSMWDSTTFREKKNQNDQQDTVRRKVHGDPPNPRVLHLGIKLSNELNGRWTSAREPVM